MPLNFQLTKKRDVIAMGRATVDLYPDRCGSLEEVSLFHKFLGGSPANTAVAIANAGCDTAFIGKVSDDSLGRFVISTLADKGIDVSHMTKDEKGKRIGFTIAQMESNQSYRCFVYRDHSADLHYNSHELDEIFISQFKSLLISGASLTSSPSREAVFLAVEYAKRNNVRVIFDPDYRADTWKDRDEASTYYWLLAEKADAIFTTQEEFEITQKIFGYSWPTERESAKALLDRGVKLLCVKHGSMGACTYTEDGKYFGKTFKNKIVNTFGAGDAFGGTCLALLIKGKPLEEAMRYAAGAAAITISGNACADSMPAWEELQAFVSERANEGQVTFEKW